MRRVWGFGVSALGLLLWLSMAVAGDEIPLVLDADEIFIASDRSSVEATGSVTAELEEISLSADALNLQHGEGGTWRFEASGNVQADIEGQLSASGDRIAATLDTIDGQARPQSLEVEGFTGRTEFTNSVDEIHTLHFVGESGQITFDEEGQASLIEVFDTEITTCDCCGLPFRSQPYTLRAQRLLLYPDRLLVVFGLTARLGGVSVFWLPVYAQPLEETLESPLFPAFGRSGLRGWYLKWNVPYFVSESLYGSILLDYYAKHDEIGAGIITRYEFAGHSGQVRIYNFPAKVGDALFEFSASHELPSVGIWTGSGSVDYRLAGDSTSLDYGAQAQGASNGWTVSVSAEREVDEENTDDEDEANDITTIRERIPEVSMSRDAWTLGVISIRPQFDIGLYREQVQTESAIEATRLSGGLNLTTRSITCGELTLTPRVSLQASGYFGDELAESQGTVHLSTRGNWRDVSATYDLRLVRGDSPFDFDAEVATHRIGVSVRRSGWADLTLSSGFDLTTGEPDPLRADLSWHLWADWGLEAEVDLIEGALGDIELDGAWSGSVCNATLSVPYDVERSEFGRIRGTLNIPGECIDLDVDASLRHGRLKVETSLDSELVFDPWAIRGSVMLSNLTLSKASLSAEVEAAAGWGGKIAWTYSGGRLSLDNVRYGIFWDIGGCLRVGVDREASDTWVYLSILAFPEAIVRYAPATSRFETGE